MSKQTKTSPTPEEKARRTLSRRRFLLVLAGGAGAVAVGAYLGRDVLVREARLAFNQVFLNSDPPSTAAPDQPLVWFRIDADNTARIVIPKIEMGQGIHTALAQIAADEADLAWETVRVVQADTHSGFNPEILFTFGSSSVTSLYAPIRRVGAALREMLRAEAARQMGVPVEAVTAANSRLSANGRTLTYGEVVAAKAGEWALPSSPRLKTREQRTLIGTSAPRVDLVEKVTGRAVYGYDARVPGMAYGAVARPPRYEAILKRAAPGGAAAAPGVIAVVIEDGFAGVVADTRAHAHAALALLDLEWEGGTTISQAEVDARMTVPAEGGTLIQRAGDVAAAGGTPVEAVYYTPMAAHAHLEPQAALAEPTADGGLTITVSTQAPNLTQSYVSSALRIEPASKVRVIPAYVGGGFGRKAGSDVGLEAARLARAAGVPVHVGWTREEDLQHGFRRPPTRNALSGMVGADGRIAAITHRLISSDVLLSPEIRATFGTSGPSFFEAVLGSDPLAAYGSQILYAVPNIRVVYHHEHLPIPTAYWRGLGSFSNIFAVESFIDELAHAAERDPLAFRRAHLPDSALGRRFAVALDRVEAESGWAAGAPEGRAFGLALCYDRKTVVALVVTVGIEAGRIRVHDAWCAVDPGLVINPDGAANQVQGSVIMGLSSTFHERWTVENGMATAANFNAYPLLRFDQAPRIHVYPIDSGDAPTGGMGEPVMGAVPAAVANGVFALTGQRLRDLPLTLETT
jgi:isoquinoline 1-oxidoreductase beta subunit